MIENSQEFADYIEESLTEDYEGKFWTEVDLDYNRRKGYMSVTFDEIEDYPSLGHFADYLMEKLGIEHPTVLSNFDPKTNTYELGVAESRAEIERVIESREQLEPTL